VPPSSKGTSLLANNEVVAPHTRTTSPSVIALSQSETTRSLTKSIVRDLPE
jgi:hypothetical protein